MYPTGPKNLNYYVWKKTYNTVEDPITASSAKLSAKQMLAAFLSEPGLSVAGDTVLLTSEDKFSKRLWCLVTEVEGDPEKPAETTEVSETQSMLVVWP